MKQIILISRLLSSSLEKYVQKRLVQEGKELAKLNFDDLPSEDDWVQIQSELDCSIIRK